MHATGGESSLLPRWDSTLPPRTASCPRLKSVWAEVCEWRLSCDVSDTHRGLSGATELRRPTQPGYAADEPTSAVWRFGGCTNRSPKVRSSASWGLESSGYRSEMYAIVS